MATTESMRRVAMRDASAEVLSNLQSLTKSLFKMARCIPNRLIYPLMLIALLACVCIAMTTTSAPVFLATLLAITFGGWIAANIIEDENNNQ